MLVLSSKKEKKTMENQNSCCFTADQFLAFIANAETIAKNKEIEYLKTNYQKLFDLACDLRKIVDPMIAKIPFNKEKCEEYLHKHSDTLYDIAMALRKIVNPQTAPTDRDQLDTSRLTKLFTIYKNIMLIIVNFELDQYTCGAQISLDALYKIYEDFRDQVLEINTAAAYYETAIALERCRKK